MGKYNCDVEKITNDVKRRAEQYADEIKTAVDKSEIVEYIDTTGVKPRFSSTDVELLDMTSEEGIKYLSDNKCSNIAVLNFASYKHPGGGYIRGAMAQEEALCHVSTLYNIISDPKFLNNYYYKHEYLNQGAYTNSHIYVKDVRFELGEESIYPIDIITCAAPNKSHAFHANNIGLLKELDTVMYSRIDQVLYSAYVHGAESLVLGAFGCGVFKNDPVVVARAFDDMLENKYRNVFKKVLFAIPSGGKSNGFARVANKNLTAFKQYIKSVY